MIFRNSRKIILANLFDFFLNFFYSFANLFNLKNISYPKTISNNPKNILLVEVFGLGDLFISFPAYKHLREILPDSYLTLVTLPDYLYAAKQFKIFDKIIPYEAFWRKESRYRFSINELTKIIKKLRSENFDLAIDLRGDLRNILFLWLTKCKHRISYGISGGGALLTDIVPFDNMVSHQSIKNLSVVKYLEYQINAKKEQALIYSPEIRNNELVKTSKLKLGIHPGAAKKEKRINSQIVIDIINSLIKKDIKPEFLIDSNNLNEYIEIKNLFGDAILFNVPENLRKLMEIIKNLDVVICADSAVGHIAAFYDKNIISFFSGEDPRQWKPFSNKIEIFKDMNFDQGRLEKIIDSLLKENTIA